MRNPIFYPKPYKIFLLEGIKMKIYKLFLVVFYLIVPSLMAINDPLFSLGKSSDSSNSLKYTNTIAQKTEKINSQVHIDRTFQVIPYFVLNGRCYFLLRIDNLKIYAPISSTFSVKVKEDKKKVLYDLLTTELNEKFHLALLVDPQTAYEQLNYSSNWKKLVKCEQKEATYIDFQIIGSYRENGKKYQEILEKSSFYKCSIQEEKAESPSLTLHLIQTSKTYFAPVKPPLSTLGFSLDKSNYKWVSIEEIKEMAKTEINNNVSFDTFTMSFIKFLNRAIETLKKS